MPAVNPARLAEEVKEIQQLVRNPQKLQWRLMDLFEFYADRTRRSQSSHGVGHADKKFGVPLPVLHALERGLKASVLEHPGLGLTISEVLWRNDYRETRYLAITLLETRPLEEILLHAEKWSSETKDFELLQKLAQSLVYAWGKRNFQGFSTASAEWLKGQHISWKLCTLMTFRYAVEDPNFSDLPFIFYLLRVNDVVGISQLRRAYLDLLRALIRRSEAESARFLLDILEKDTSKGRKLIRALLECFPTDQQLKLKRALSTQS